ncbi:MAG TPA: ABC transporter permease [Chitinophagaceae bacterium]|nr:ABC transporter permease [Chitinophagaceae bacterium]
MLHLLKIEWLKVKNYRTFWILGILYILSIFGINYIVYEIQQEIYLHNKQTADAAKMILGSPPYSFPAVWQMTCYVSSFLLFIAGLLMIISVTNEYSYKTHRQNIIDGETRTQFIVTKLACGAVIAVVSTFIVFITAFYFGLVDGSSSFSLSDSEYIFYFFLQALSYCWLAVLVSLVFKRSGISIGVFFLYVIVLENVLSNLLNYLANDFSDGPGKFLPIQSSDKLMPLPVFKDTPVKVLDNDTNIPLQVALVCAYLAAYFFLSKRKFETDDL